MVLKNIFGDAGKDLSVSYGIAADIMQFFVDFSLRSDQQFKTSIATFAACALTVLAFQEPKFSAYSILIEGSYVDQLAKKAGLVEDFNMNFDPLPEIDDGVFKIDYFHPEGECLPVEDALKVGAGAKIDLSHAYRIGNDGFTVIFDTKSGDWMTYHINIFDKFCPDKYGKNFKTETPDAIQDSFFSGSFGDNYLSKARPAAREITIFGHSL